METLIGIWLGGFIVAMSSNLQLDMGWNRRVLVAVLWFAIIPFAWASGDVKIMRGPFGHSDPPAK